MGRAIGSLIRSACCAFDLNKGIATDSVELSPPTVSGHVPRFGSQGSHAPRLCAASLAAPLCDACQWGQTSQRSSRARSNSGKL